MPGGPSWSSEAVCSATSSSPPRPASTSVVRIAFSADPSGSSFSSTCFSPVPSSWGSAPCASRLTGASLGGRTSSSITGVMNGGSSICS